MSDGTEPSGVFGKAGQAPPPPPTDAPAPSTGTLLPASAIGKFAFYALIPAILLPFVIVASALLLTVLRPEGGYEIDHLVVAVFCFVLIGSIALNTWLILRRPQTWQQKSLPKGLAVVLVVLWVLEIVAAVVVGVTRPGPLTIAIAIALMVISILVFGFAIARMRVKIATVPETAVRLSPYGAVLGWGYLVLVVVGLAISVPLVASSGPAMLVGALVVLGLPWSWPLTVVGFLAASVPVLSIAIGVIILAGVVLNIVVVVMLMIRPAFRVRFINWFFKLRGDPNDKSAIRTFSAPPETT